MNANIEWIDSGKVGVGAPVSLKQDSYYRVRAVADFSCPNTPIASIIANLAATGWAFPLVVTGEQAVSGSSTQRLDQRSPPWPSSLGVPATPLGPNKCYVFIEAKWNQPDQSFDSSIFSPPGLTTLELWERGNPSQLLIGGPSVLPTFQYQLWFQDASGVWYPYGAPEAVDAGEVRRRIEAAAAPGSPLLGYSRAGESGPTFVFSGGTWGLPSEVQPGPDLAAIGREFLDAGAKAVAACPQLAAPTSPLSHAIAAYNIFSAAGGDPQTHLDTFKAQLDVLCPTWKSGVPGVPDPAPPQVPDTPLPGFLKELDDLIKSGQLAALPELAQRISAQGFAAFAEQILAYAREKGIKPGDGTTPDTPTNGETPTPEDTPTSKKKGISGGLVAAMALIGIGIAAVAFS